MLLPTGKAGPLLKPRNTSVAFSPNRTKPPAISFTISGRQVGVSCIIKRPVTGVNPNIFCSLTRLRFGASAFVSPRLSLLASQTERQVLEAAGTGDVEVTFRPGPWEPPPLERIGWRPTRSRPIDRSRKGLPLGLHCVTVFPRSMNNPGQ